MCGIFAYHASREIDGHDILIRGLRSSQHRGQTAFGIAYNNNTVKTYQGHVSPKKNPKIQSKNGLAHTRYGTYNGTSLEFAHPMHFEANARFPAFAIAMNGTISNTKKAASKLRITLKIDSDTYLLGRLIQKKRSWAEALTKACELFEGAFTFVAINETTTYAFRDPSGLKPLCYGMKDGIYYIASESAVLDDQDIPFIRDIKPGELIILDGNNLDSLQVYNSNKTTCDPFELIYFARPDSIIDGIPITPFRFEMGRRLAQRDDFPFKKTNTVVTDVPHSGSIYAEGYAAEKGIPFIPLFLKLHNNRAFISNAGSRAGIAKKKIVCRPGMSNYLGTENVVAFDDSIIRGDTCRTVTVPTLKKAGFHNIHLRSAFWEVKGTCPWGGIDLREPGRQVMRNLSLEEATRWLRVKSLLFGSPEDIIFAVQKSSGRDDVQIPHICTVCHNI